MSKTPICNTAAAIAGALMLAGPAAALTDDEVDAIRDQIAAAERGGRTGAGYAQLLGFVTDPDASAATLFNDGPPENRLDIYKLPLQFRVAGRGGWDLFVRAGLNYATYETDGLLADFPSSDNIDADFKVYSGSLGLVGKRPLNEHWTFVAALDAGVARFENDADYRGIAEVFAPVFDDLILNWTTNAGLASGVAGLEYRGRLERLELRGTAEYIHSYISSFGESGDFIGFSEHTDTVHASLDVTHPWYAELGGYPLFGVVHVGNTTFLGDNRDALGFETLWSVGYALQLDVGREAWPVRSLKLGANYLRGDSGFDGYELVLGYRF